MGFPIPQTGTVTEDVNVIAGNLVASGDADLAFIFGGTQDGNWQAETITGSLGGVLVIDNDGVWDYGIDNSLSIIQSLNTGDTLTEVFTITSIGGPGGSPTTTVTITIQGADEPPCFTRGTMIDTPQGPRPIEDLRTGDAVLTSDRGPQEILWVGSRRITASEFEDFDKLRPIRIRAGAFGPGIPSHDVSLSPAHRVQVRGPSVQLLIGRSQVFCAAHHLINGATIFRDHVTEVEYFHILLEDHAVIWANGCPAESFLPGPLGLNGFADEAREEVFTLFPELRGVGQGYGPPARQVARRHEAALLAPEARYCQTPDWLSPDAHLSRLAG